MNTFKTRAWLGLTLMLGLSLAQAKGEFRPEDQLQICEWDKDSQCVPLDDAQVEKFQMRADDIADIKRMQSYALRPKVTGAELVEAFGSPLGRIQPNRDVLLIWSMGEKVRPGTAVLMLAREETVIRSIFRVGNQYSVKWASPAVKENLPMADVKSPDAKPDVKPVLQP
jgi:hypothetical protein